MLGFHLFLSILFHQQLTHNNNLSHITTFLRTLYLPKFMKIWKLFVYLPSCLSWSIYIMRNAISFPHLYKYFTCSIIKIGHGLQIHQISAHNYFFYWFTNNFLLSLSILKIYIEIASYSMPLLFTPWTPLLMGKLNHCGLTLWNSSIWFV